MAYPKPLSDKRIQKMYEESQIDENMKLYLQDFSMPVQIYTDQSY